MKQRRIGVDLMGSESAPDLLFDAIAKASHKLGLSDAIVAFATEDVVKRFSADPIAKSACQEKIEWVIVKDVIKMDASPLYAVRHKRKSSMIQAVFWLKDKRLDALISAGNTGALIASSTILLPMLPGIERPALLALLPTSQGVVAVIDVGGHVYCKPHHIVQFAKMGSAYHRCCLQQENPTVGLLNIGAESKKGTAEHCSYYEALKTYEKEDSHIVFKGNIEGREAFQGKVDVLVTDGFTGNVFLKTSEGVSGFILGFLHEAFAGNPGPQCGQVLKSLEKVVDYDEYPGAIVCGVDRIVIKCHGSVSSRAMFKAIMSAHQMLDANWLGAMKKQLAQNE